MKIQSFPTVKFICLLFFCIMLLAGFNPWAPEDKAQAQTGTTNSIPKLMKAPQPGISYYVKKGVPDFDLYTLGFTDARRYLGYIKKGYKVVSIFHFGQPCSYMSGGTRVFGTSGYDDTCYSTAEIQNDVQSFIGGFCDNLATEVPNTTCGYGYPASPMLTLGIGTSNCTNGGPTCTNPNQGNNVTYEHGQAWGQLVSSVRSFIINNDYQYQINIVGANDIELNYDTPGHTRAWVDGYVSATSLMYYNFGACEGCPNYLANGWTPADVYYVSAGVGAGRVRTLPEIYNRNGAQAVQWRSLSEYMSVRGSPPIAFPGAFTQWQACQQRNCQAYQTDNTNYQAASQLAVEISLSLDPSVRNTISSILSGSDIRWYPNDP